jgi:hypothetical protein
VPGELTPVLIEDAFGKVWRLVGERGELEIEAVDLERWLAGLRSELIVFSQPPAGEGRRAAWWRELLSTGRGWPLSWSAQRRWPSTEGRVSTFRVLGLPAIVSRGERLSRRNVVKYVTNRLGGKHFDSKRKASEQPYVLLDHVMKSFEILERRAVYFELLSIGQSVAESKDASLLRDGIEKGGVG